MTGGERAERAFRKVGQAYGIGGLVTMVVSQKLSRASVERVITLLQQAIDELKLILEGR